MKIERAWKNQKGQIEEWKEITEDMANRELANAHGDNAIKKLNESKTLNTRFAEYRIGE